MKKVGFQKSQGRVPVDDHQTFYEEVGRRIRRVRKQRKLTQLGLAELVSLTRTSITNIEKGRQKFLIHTLAEIAEALKVGPASLLPEPESETDLDHALKNRSQEEKEWIKSSVLAMVRKEKADDGS